MTKMSKAQRIAILDFHNGVTSKRHTMLASARTVDVLVREGWAKRPEEMTRRLVQQFPPSVRRMAYVTTAGLIAAGIDMDAIHTEALIEDFLRHPSMVRAQEIGAAERQRAEAPEVDNRAEIGAARTQRFHALFKITRDWPAALDIRHAEALADDVVREARAIVPEPKRLLPEGAPVVVLRGELDRMHETFVAQAALDEAYREDRNRGNIEMAKRAAVRLNREFAANADALSAELAREV